MERASDRPSQQSKAESFRQMHTNPKLLVLPNIWDPIGARVLQAKGCPAVATASAAVSASLGYEDGEKIRFKTLLGVIKRIARSVDIPVTADIEAGFAESTTQLQENIERIVVSGVVGINLEDSLVEGGDMRSVDQQCERLATARAAAGRQGLALVINARVDSFVSGNFGSRADRFADAVTRARAYAEAGADCVYPMGPADAETAKDLRQQIPTAINLLVSPAAAPLAVLQEIGIDRASCGPFMFRACLGHLVDIVEEMRHLGSYQSLGRTMLTGEETQRFLVEGSEKKI